MNKIEVKVLNPEVIETTKKMTALGARLTQHGHQIKNMNDLTYLYDKGATDQFINGLSNLPHPTLFKLSKINVAIVGASRRFLAQITRHQDGVKFVSASLQYSNYSGNADFVVPYHMLGNEEATTKYIESCKKQMDLYTELCDSCGHDEAGYAAPQGLRNILIISATPFEFKHIISQRICRRNTDETRYVMLKIWEQLYELSPEIFGNAGCFCINGNCQEGRFSCGSTITAKTPSEILEEDFSNLCRN